jgi:Sigma-70 region 3
MKRAERTLWTKLGRVPALEQIAEEANLPLQQAYEVRSAARASASLDQPAPKPRRSTTWGFASGSRGNEFGRSNATHSSGSQRFANCEPSPTEPAGRPPRAQRNLTTSSTTMAISAASTSSAWRASKLGYCAELGFDTLQVPRKLSFDTPQARTPRASRKSGRRSKPRAYALNKR